MKTEKMTLVTEITGSDDGKKTYEIMRKWSDKGKKAVVIELYPGIGTETIQKMDLSYMHLNNHLAELEVGEVHIVNLFSTVFDYKPLAKYLAEDTENIEYIQKLCLRKDIDYILIAYGSTLGNHQVARMIKTRLLKFLMEKKLEKKVKHLVVEYLDTNQQIGTHPLYLGLRFSKEQWFIEDFPLKYAYEELTKCSVVDASKKDVKKKSDSKKGETEDAENVLSTEK